MYAYLRGVYKGHSADSDEVMLIEVGGVGYEVIVPPIVEQEISAGYPLESELLLYVSAQSGRDQPWPVLWLRNWLVRVCNHVEVSWARSRRPKLWHGGVCGLVVVIW